MTKAKKRIGIALFLIIALVCLVLPFVVGMIAEREYRNGIANLNKSTGAGVIVQLRAFDRGWFSSDAVIDIEYQGKNMSKPIKTSLRDQVAHGPLPWRSWTASEQVMASSSPGLATLRNTLKLSQLEGVTATPALPDLTVQTRLGFAGNTVTQLQFPAYKGRVSVPGFDIDIDTKGVAINLDTDEQGNYLKLIVETDYLNAKGYAELTGITLKATWDKAKQPDSVLAPITFMAESIKVGGGGAFLAENLSVTVQENTENELLTRRAQLNFQTLNIASKRQWQQGDVELLISGINPVSMQTLRGTENRMWGGRLGLHFMFDYRLGLDEQWPTLFADDGKISFNINRLRSPEGGVIGGVILNTKDADKNYPVDSTLRRFQRDASFTIDRTLLQDVYYQRDLAKASAWQRLMPDRQAKARQHAVKVINYLKEKGLLKETKTGYSTTGFGMLQELF